MKGAGCCEDGVSPTPVVATGVELKMSPSFNKSTIPQLPLLVVVVVVAALDRAGTCLSDDTVAFHNNR